MHKFWIYAGSMNNSKIKIYKRVLKEVSEKYYGAEEFVSSGIEQICSQQKLSAEEVIYFLCFFLAF